MARMLLIIEATPCGDMEMKITNDHIFAELSGANKSGQANGGEQSQFAEMLAEMVAEKIQPSQSAGATESAQAVDPASRCGELPYMWHQVNQILDSLDAYGEALGDPKNTLKQMEPLVRSLEEQADKLEAELAEAEDSSLTGLASEAVMSARVESMKYWRGDYIS
jgi:hypothetical protein